DHYVASECSAREDHMDFMTLPDDVKRIITDIDHALQQRGSAEKSVDDWSHDRRTVSAVVQWNKNRGDDVRADHHDKPGMCQVAHSGHYHIHVRRTGTASTKENT